MYPEIDKGYRLISASSIGVNCITKRYFEFIICGQGKEVTLMCTGDHL